ncbi:arylsulfatase [Leifsonia shinshuensis]|uniref:Arylsulfatase n=1 Tax=Leifsonia shinshuensis TaxID=150026 RepID=A0A7G6YD68_9MICO|nr:arylsulfatase [Leifsonia shinshuensis]QNE36433.1 arylsulfatase [Leifsonia shinshuensis]
MADDGIQRGSLPIPDRRDAGFTTFDAKDPDTSYPPITRLRPPAGAPNVLIVLLDDVGFGASSAFGGPVHMPTAERLAATGLRYNRFHTTALCSPTRAALLSGRNHHAVGMGSITELATSAPGYSSLRPNSMQPLAEILRLNGYATAHFGKCHEVPQWETSPAGPFDRWPSPGNGFEKFYGFIGGEASQYYPALHEGTTPVDPPRTPEEGYHLTEDLTDHAIEWIREQKALAPDKPFFAYVATGATHTPHHVPPEWSAKYRGAFDDGWDALRESTFRRQKEVGAIGPDAELTARPDEIPAWDDMPDELKPVLRREAENYAGFLEHTDHHVGRLLDDLEAQGILQDTLVFYIIGDNGASAEGGIDGTFKAMVSANGGDDLQTAAVMTAELDKWGGPESYPHYAVGWAHAFCTPYQWTKQVASHWGGTRNATIVHWPAGIADGGGFRSQFTHVIDVAPTVLEAAGLPAPATVHGVTQEPLHGTSMTYTFASADAPERHDTQYFEMMCNRGIYHRGWSAVTKHRTPWHFTGSGPAFEDDVWELYDGNSDWTQSHDLAAEQPEKLAALQRLFFIQASRFDVFPLDDRLLERLTPRIAGRPELVEGDEQLLFAGMRSLSEDNVVNLKNRSHSVTAEVVIPDGGAEGVILGQGGLTGGWVLYLKEGALAYAYNFVGYQVTRIAGGEPVPPGEHQLRMEFAYDGGGVGKGGTVTLFVDGAETASGRVERTHITSFNLDETNDVGRDTGSRVVTDYPATGNDFTGTIKVIRVVGGDDGQGHLVDPEQLHLTAMLRQ